MSSFNARTSGVSIAIVAVALVIIIAAVIETRPPGDRQTQANAAATARALAVATEGPAAGRAPLIPPANVADPSQNVSDRCAAAKGTATPGGVGDVNPLVAADAPAVNIADGGRMDGRSKHIWRGWALAPGPQSVLTALCLSVDDKIQLGAKVVYGAPRSDVAAAYHRGDLTACGFQVDIAPHAIPKGRHRLVLIGITPGGALAELPGARTVTVY